MARIDYHAITKAVRDVLRADQGLKDWGQISVEAEDPVPIAINRLPHVGVYARDRAPAARQTLRAGTSQRYAVAWEVWVTAFSAKGFEDAAEQRDELLGLVELALMRRRDLGGAVPSGALDLRGGSFDGGQGAEGGWIAQASVRLGIELEATT